MSAFQMFVTEQELGSILHEFAHTRGLVGDLESNRLFELYDPEQSSFEFLQRADVTKFYLLPRTQALPNPPSDDAISPRYLGWIDVWIGHLVVSTERGVLTMTTIQAENRQNPDFKPANWLRGLKRSLTSTFTFSVMGRNVVYGGEHVYQDIGYSPTALQLYREGVVWKQYATDNGEYSPVT